MSEFSKTLRDISLQSFSYGLSTILSRLIGFISVPILAHYFSTEQYGTISLVQVALSLAVIIAGMNVGSGVSFYFFKHESKDVKKKILGSGVVYMLIASFLISLSVFVFSDAISDILNLRQNKDSYYSFQPYLEIGSIYLFFGILMTAIQNILRLHKEPYKYLVCELVNFGTNILVLVLLVCVFETGLEGVFWARAAGVFAGSSCGLFYVRKRYTLCLSSSLLLPVLFYSLPQFPASLLGWGQGQASRLLINYFTDLHEQGLFATAFILASVLNLANAAFRLAYDPYALSIMKNENAKDMYAKIFTVYSFTLGILLICFLCSIRSFVSFITPEEYHSCYVISYFLAGSFFMAGCNNILGTGIWVTGRTIFSSYCQVFTFVTVLVSGFLLIPIYKATGAALSLFLGSLVHSLVLFFMTQKIYKVNYRYIQSVIFVVVSVMVIFSTRNISNEVFSVLLISFICFLTLGFFAYLILMPRGAIRFIRKQLRV